jgi:antitoxin component YwqK of YwqJK toxin-antitoxin module
MKSAKIIRRLITGMLPPTVCLAALLPFAVAASSDGLSVRAECRNGVPDGEYRVESAQGRVRIEGSFVDGLRNGEFVFYTANGDRMIVLPYTRGLLNGTVKAWHVGAGDANSPLKLLSDIRAGYIKGRHRTWYENGKPRSDFVVDEGEIAAGETWNPDGTVLEIKDHAQFLSAEIQSDFAYYSRLEQVMDAHPPAC